MAPQDMSDIGESRWKMCTEPSNYTIVYRFWNCARPLRCCTVSPMPGFQRYVSVHP